MRSLGHPITRFALCGALLLAAFGTAQAQTRENPFRDAKSWAFQLKNLDATEQAKLAASPYDVIVIDSEDYPGGVERRLTRAEVDAMKKKPDGSRRRVTGEAKLAVESERFEKRQLRLPQSKASHGFSAGSFSVSSLRTFFTPGSSFTTFSASRF